MADILKKFTKHMDGINAARKYDAAAKMVAEHCDARIEKARRYFTKIAQHAEDGQNGSTRYAQDRLTQIQKVAELGLIRQAILVGSCSHSSGYARGYGGPEAIKALLGRSLVAVSQGIEELSPAVPLPPGTPAVTDFAGIRRKELAVWVERLRAHPAS